jgi:endo-1,4-beta-xylanase
VIVDVDTVRLRAERSGIGDGRLYTFTYLATDSCGNTTEVVATVTVPLKP